MNHFKIKVCGITRLRDALLAERLGADMLGFVFYSKSPRHLSVADAKVIVDKLSATIGRVGVFVEPNLSAMQAAARELKLDYIQLHGVYNNALVRQLRNSGHKVIQSFHVESAKDYQEIWKSIADIVHLDNKSEQSPGGTGKQFNWTIRPRRKIPNLMLAGGINIKNVQEGLKRFQPLVIDVNSGVESKPGIKSEAKLKQFFKLCNQLRYGVKN
jgi:phosphoribosylanthranilate isomerase